MPGTIAAHTPLQQFIDVLSAKTKLDPRVLAAWAQQEGAYAPNGTGHYNFFNLRPKSGGSSWSGVKLAGVSSRDFAQFANAQDAATETAWWLNNMSNYAGIRAAAGKGTPATQISAIAASPWDEGHYGGHGGINLKATFASLFGSKQLNTPAESVGSGGGIDVGKIVTDSVVGGAVDAATGGLGGLIPDLPKSLNPVAGLTSWAEGKAAYATLYAALVMFSITLALIGVLRLLGIRFGSVVEIAGKSAAGAAVAA